MLDPYSAELVWIVVVGFIIAFILAFAVGANDGKKKPSTPS